MRFRQKSFECTWFHGRFLGVWLLLIASFAEAADLGKCRKFFQQGDYTSCIRLSQQAIDEKARDEEWPLLLMRSLLAVGRYPDAQAALTNALGRYDSSIRVRLAGRDVLNANGRPDRARALLDEVNDMAGARTWAYRDPPNLVALGRAALLLGAEPKLVLENFFDRAKQADPDLREAYLASGELALEKEDYQLAAKTYGAALKKFPEDADLHCGLARAYAPDDRAQMLKSIAAALDFNTNHVPSLLLLASHAIDAEDYEAAGATLTRVLSVNPWQPEAWAYRALLAHLRNDTNAETEARATALKFWDTNPMVDFLIGQKLSLKYRFAEGAERQRQALHFDTAFLPAKIQLAQDLLRLGQEDAGWTLADEVHQRDGYDVTAYNLVTLREAFGKLETLTNADFTVRMSPREATIYGDRVLDLLQRARERLSGKYGLKLEHPTIVEIFPEQKDFAVRTFGMPGNPGYLGVCFGRVITANSPASQAAHPANWQAVLWHEFCHVITLQLTRNRMPRWLSEGISVYEEKQANPVWGQAMNPRYREMILGGELTPVGELSAAFLAPKSDVHLQFAYYESSLVVEFLVNKFGLQNLKGVLHDLADGKEINAAIAAHTGPMEQIEKDFASFARERAEQFGPGLDWKKSKTGEDLTGSSETVTNSTGEQLRRRYGLGPASRAATPASLDLASTNFWVLLRGAKELIGEKKWEQAEAPLKKLIELCPDCTGADSPYHLLAMAYRGLNETNSEREVLSKLAGIEADDTDVFLRLMELNSAAKDWDAVAENAKRFLAVNPLLPQPYRYLARADEEMTKPQPAIHTYETLLLLDPPDVADVHYRLAKLFHEAGDAQAKRQVLQALEEAPRFRDAQKLLLAIERAAPERDKAETAIPSPK